MGSLSLSVSRASGGVVLPARTSKSMYPSWVHTAAGTEVQESCPNSNSSVCQTAAVFWPQKLPGKEQVKNKQGWGLPAEHPVGPSPSQGITHLLVCAGHRGTPGASPLPQSPRGNEKSVSKRTGRTELQGSSPHVAGRQVTLLEHNARVALNTYNGAVQSALQPQTVKSRRPALL